MNIGKPMISRLLGRLIQTVHPGDQLRFIKDARKAEHMRDFLQKYRTYRKSL